MQMLRRRRFVPLSTSTFDYTSYHTLEEVILCMGEAQDLGQFGGKKNCILELLLQGSLF